MILKRLKAVFDFYLYSNLHMALCTVALLKASCMVLHLRCETPLMLIAFFGTITLYSFQRLVGVLKNEMKDFKGERHQWNFRNKKILILIVVLSLAPLAYSFFELSLNGKFLLIGAGLLSLIYASPVFKIKSKLFRLRDFPVIKIFFIAIVWTIVTTILPIIESVEFYNRSELVYFHGAIYWSAVVFLLIFALTIPFDVRDMEFDSPSIRSLPMIIGEKQAVRLAQFLLVISCIALYIGMEQTHKFSFITVIYYFLWAAFSIWILHSCSRKKNEYYFSFTVDGLIIALWGFLAFERYIQ